jgi:hypothetical protein
MNAPATDVRSLVSEEEWAQRVDLAACYRLIARFGWDDLIFTHVSARVPGPGPPLPDQPVRPAVRGGHRVEPGQGRPRRPQGARIAARREPAGFVIHSAIHAARDDAHCVLHVHSVNGVAVSAKESGLRPVSQHSIFVASSLAYHDYEGVALVDDEKARLVRDLGDSQVPDAAQPRPAHRRRVGRRRVHGHVPVRDELHDPGPRRGRPRPVREIGDAIVAGAQAQWKQVTRGVGGGLAWPALLRRLDRSDAGYRQ